MEILSRLRITGKLDANTPVDVILEIAEAHGISQDRINQFSDLDGLIEEINKEDVNIVELPLNESSYGAVAQFVNPNEDWKLEELLTAYNYLLSFTDPKQFQDLTADFVYAPQSMNNLNSINASVTYAACRHFDIQLDASTTEEEMCHALRNYLTDKDVIINSIIDRLIHLEISDLIKLKLHLIPNNKIKHNKTKKRTKYTYEELKTAAESIIRYYPIKTAINSYEPGTVYDAVAAASIHFNFDISETPDPIQIFYQLRDGKWKGKLQRQFNLKFPLALYSNENLDYLLCEQGYSSEELDDLDKSQKYEILATANLSENFYHGVLTPYSNKETLIDLIAINELKDYSAVSYGYSTFYVFTYQELLQHFITSGVLSHPITKEVFNKIQLKKLIYLTGINNHLEEPIEHKEIRSKLRELLLSKSDNLSDNSIKILAEKVLHDSSGLNKDAIEKILWILTKIGMNMRGWNDQTEFPIEKSFDLDPIIIEERVHKGFNELDIYIKNFSEIGDLINSIPLVKYHQGKYINSTKEAGLTIGERLNIVKNKLYDVNSCIRLSSNYILATVYKTCLDLNLNCKFEVKKLRHIS